MRREKREELEWERGKVDSICFLLDILFHSSHTRNQQRRKENYDFPFHSLSFLKFQKQPWPLWFLWNSGLHFHILLPYRIYAKAEFANSTDSGSIEQPLGILPHQVRGSLSQFSQMTLVGHSSNSCTACSCNVSLYIMKLWWSISFKTYKWSLKYVHCVTLVILICQFHL